MIEIGDRDLDPKLLLLDVQRHVDHEAVPTERTVVAFQFSDVTAKLARWWIVLTPAEADLCDADLRGATFRGADLTETDLRWAKYELSELVDVDLTATRIRM